MKKRNNIYYVASVIIFIAILPAFIQFINDFNKAETTVFLKSASLGFIPCMKVIISTLTLITIFTAFIWIPCLIKKITDRKYKKMKLNEADFLKEKNYFRDIIKNHNPSELSYIDNFEIDYNTLVAEIINMQNKKIIEYKDNKFYVIKDNNLTEVEKYITSLINNNGTDKIKVNKLEYKNCLINECIKDNLLIKNNDSAKQLLFGVSKVVCITITIFVISNILSSYVFMNAENITEQLAQTLITISVLGFFSLTLLIAIGVFMVIATNLKFSGNDYNRTENGNIINLKLEGLKNFIKDF